MEDNGTTYRHTLVRVSLSTAVRLLTWHSKKLPRRPDSAPDLARQKSRSGLPPHELEAPRKGEPTPSHPAVANSGDSRSAPSDFGRQTPETVVLWVMSAGFGTCEVRCLEKLHCKNEKRRDEDERQDWMQFAKRKRGTWM